MAVKGNSKQQTFSDNSTIKHRNEKVYYFKTTFIESTLEYITVSNFHMFLSTSNKPSLVKKFP